MKNINRNKVLSKGFTNGKGFTIVELVIVIAVIGILAAVLIPTFNSIINNANISKANQEITNAMKEYITTDVNTNLDDLVIIYSEEGNVKYIFGYKDRSLFVFEEPEYEITNNILYLNHKKYINILTTSLSNFPEHILIYKHDATYIKYQITIKNDDYKSFITKENKEALEGMYLPGERVVITPKLNDESGIRIIINSEIVKELMFYDNPYHYEFIMPNEDIVIAFDKIDIPTVNVEGDLYLKDLYPFISDLAYSEINEIYYISNQTPYTNNILSKCIYLKNNTIENNSKINNILLKLKNISYSLTNETIEETGLPREKYFILTDDKTYGFYFEKYVSYNGKNYKMNNYESLFDETALSGYSLMRNDMPITMYLSPVFVGGKETTNYIDLRRIIINESNQIDEEYLYDKSTKISLVMPFLTAQIKELVITDSKHIKIGDEIYCISNDYSFENIKKINKVTVYSEYRNYSVIYDKDIMISEEELLSLCPDMPALNNRYVFSYDNEIIKNIFDSGKIKIDSDKIVYYVKNTNVTLQEKYEFIKDLKIDNIKEIYITEGNQTEDLLQKCSYILNSDNNKVFFTDFVNSLQNDTFKLIADNNQSNETRKCVIITLDNVYEIIYDEYIQIGDATYKKESTLLEIPEEVSTTGYTFINNNNNNYITDVYKHSKDIESGLEVNIDTNKDIDLRKIVLTIKEDNDDKIAIEEAISKYLERTFLFNNTICTMKDDETLLINNNYYYIINEFSLYEYLDEIIIKLEKLEINESNGLALSTKELIIKRDSIYTKDEFLDLIEIANYSETEKYYIDIKNYFVDTERETFKYNTIIFIDLRFGNEISIEDINYEYVSRETYEKYSKLLPYKENVEIPLLEVKNGYVGVKLNGEIVKILSKDSQDNSIRFCLKEDTKITFEKSQSLYDLCPEEIEYKDMYPFINDLNVEDIVEIIQIDKHEKIGNFYKATFVKNDNNDAYDYTYELLRFFKEEKCTYVFGKVDVISDSKIIIVTKNGHYEIDNYNIFTINGRTYESLPLSPLPNRIKVDGYTFTEDMVYLKHGTVFERINPQLIVFNKYDNQDYIIGSAELELVSDIYFDSTKVMIYNNKKLVYEVSSGLTVQREDLEIINSFSFEKYLPCISIPYELNIYKMISINNQKLCTISVKYGDIISKERLINLLDKYELEDDSSFYIYKDNQTFEKLFENNSNYEVISTIDIYVE